METCLGSKAKHRHDVMTFISNQLLKKKRLQGRRPKKNTSYRVTLSLKVGGW